MNFNMKGFLKIFLLLMAFTVFSACDDKTKDKIVVITTPYGEMRAVLYEETPKHKRNFLELAESGKYDSTIFHRVIENFMIQGGDLKTGVYGEEVNHLIESEFMPEKYIHEKGALAAARMGDAVNPEKKSSGSQFYIVQGEKYNEMTLKVRAERREYLKLEGFFQRLRRSKKYPEVNEKWKELMEQYRSDTNFNYQESLLRIVYGHKHLIEKEFGEQKDPGFSEFQKKRYAEVGGTPHLDGEYTVFGKVVEGLEVIDKIAAVSTDRQDKPMEDIPMTIRIEKVPKKEITERYGIRYETNGQ